MLNDNEEEPTERNGQEIKKRCVKREMEVVLVALPKKESRRKRNDPNGTGNNGNLSSPVPCRQPNGFVPHGSARRMGSVFGCTHFVHPF